MMQLAISLSPSLLLLSQQNALLWSCVSTCIHIHIRFQYSIYTHRLRLYLLRIQQGWMHQASMLRGARSRCTGVCRFGTVIQNHGFPISTASDPQASYPGEQAQAVNATRRQVTQETIHSTSTNAEAHNQNRKESNISIPDSVIEVSQSLTLVESLNCLSIFNRKSWKIATSRSDKRLKGPQE